MGDIAALIDEAAEKATAAKRAALLHDLPVSMTVADALAGFGFAPEGRRRSRAAGRSACPQRDA